MDDRTWKVPEMLQTDEPANAFVPNVAVDSAGNAIVVWVEREGDTRGVWANYFTPAGGWTGAERIQLDDGDSFYFDVAMDSQGNALAVWSQKDEFHKYSIYAAQFAPSQGWGTPEIISTNEREADYPAIAFDPSDNAMAVWTDYAGTWFNRFNPSDGWGTAELIHASVLPATPDVVLDAEGNAVATWFLVDTIWSARYTPSGGWGAAEEIETDVTLVSAPILAGDPLGNAMATWTQRLSRGFTILAKRFTPSGGWGATEHVGDDIGTAVGRWVAMDAEGNAIVVWDEAFVNQDVWANRFTPSGGRGTPERIEFDGGSASAPFVTMRSNGEALAAWNYSAGETFRVVVNRFRPSAGWGTPQVIGGADSGGGPNPPRLGIDAEGNAVATWLLRNDNPSDPRSQVWANHYD